jgi:hypothetical protein
MAVVFVVFLSVSVLACRNTEDRLTRCLRDIAERNFSPGRTVVVSLSSGGGTSVDFLASPGF